MITTATVGGGGKGKKDGGLKVDTTVVTGRGAIDDVVDAEEGAMGMEGMQHQQLAASPSFRLVQENHNVPKDMEEEEEEEQEEEVEEQEEEEEEEEQQQQPRH